VRYAIRHTFPCSIDERLDPVTPSQVVRVSLVVVMAAVAAATTRAQTQPAAGVIEGTVSTQHGSVRLPGALVSVRGSSDDVVAEQVADEQGRFTISGVPAAHYRVRASLDGFQTTDAPVVVAGA